MTKTKEPPILGYNSMQVARNKWTWNDEDGAWELEARPYSAYAYRHSDDSLNWCWLVVGEDGGSGEISERKAKRMAERLIEKLARETLELLDQAVAEGVKR